LAAVARVGLWHWEHEQHAAFGNQRLSASSEGTDVLFGVGLEWTPVSHWAVGLEASRYRTDAEDFDLLAASLKYPW
jgi:hypothetical protein